MIKTNILLGILAVTAAAPLLRAQLTVSNAVDYSSGKYGQRIRTDIFTDEVTAGYDYQAWTGKVIIAPYEEITGPGNVVPRIGRIRRVVRFVQTKQTHSGFGDIELSGSYDAYQDESSGWDASLTGEVKFGTASASKNLGTGKDDFSPSIDVSRTLGKFTPWLNVGYWFVGKPAGTNLRDYAYGTLGTSYAVDDSTSVSLSFDCSERSSDASNVANDVALDLNRKLDKSWSVDAYVLAGLSKAAPDFEVNGSVSYKF